MYYAFASYINVRREDHLYEVFFVLVLAKLRLILDRMCRLHGKFTSYLRRILCKTRLIFPRINGPIVNLENRVWSALLSPMRHTPPITLPGIRASHDSHRENSCIVPT